MTNVNLKAVEARRYQDQPANPKIRIDHNSHISLVQVEGDGLKVEFQFTTSYGALGVVKVEGGLRVQGIDAKAAEKQWQETRNMPPDVAQQVHAAILQACVPEAVVLSKEVRLPPPIPLPQVRIGEGPDAQAQSKAPSDSPEIG